MTHHSKYWIFCRIVLVATALTFLTTACGRGEKTTDKTSDKITSGKTVADSASSDETNPLSIRKSDFEKVLKDPKKPAMAVELYNNTYRLKDDEPMVLLENLHSNDVLKRWFYFRVITNSYKIADGAYSEGLGFEGKKYIENNTTEFAAYFDNHECFADSDLETWANIALLEFKISGEKSNGKYDSEIVSDYCKKLKANCANAPSNQQETIDKFCRLLSGKYNALSLGI